MTYITGDWVDRYSRYKKDIDEVAKTSPKIKFSLFEKGQAIAPDKWVLQKKYVFYLDEIATKKEAKQLNRIYGPYYSLISSEKQYIVYSFSFVDIVKYRIWLFFYKIAQKKIEKRKEKAELNKQRGEQLEILAKGMEMDIERLIKETDKEITQARELIEGMKLDV